MSEKKQQAVQCIITPEIKERQKEFERQIQQQRIAGNINPKSNPATFFGTLS